ncbi:MAG: type II toxin-antitoxin system HicA family toxin [Alphaproteobacteria bacterium]|nr:type II toxin-antitoxin system HicA family toxin [Alphaproteobacteria bacterium]
MRLPRDVSGAVLVAALRRLGYEKVRQRGSHVRVTTQEGGEHHEVIPLRDPIRAKTLSSILKSVARHHGIGVQELLRRLDLR